MQSERDPRRRVATLLFRSNWHSQTDIRSC